MVEIGVVRQVSGELIPASRYLRLRIEATKLEQPQDVLLAVHDVQCLIGLLLRLSGRAGTAPETVSNERTVRPVGVDAVALGTTSDGTTILELNVGSAALAFGLPASACRPLGQALLTLTATPTLAPN